MRLTPEQAAAMGIHVEEPRVPADLQAAMDAARQRRGGELPPGVRGAGGGQEDRAPLTAEYDAGSAARQRDEIDARMARAHDAEAKGAPVPPAHVAEAEAAYLRARAEGRNGIAAFAGPIAAYWEAKAAAVGLPDLPDLVRSAIAKAGATATSGVAEGAHRDKPRRGSPGRSTAGRTARVLDAATTTTATMPDLAPGRSADPRHATPATTTATERDPRVANLGQEWERVLNAQHDAYRLARTADVEKIPTPVTQLGPGRTDEKGRPVFTGMRAAQSTTDFVGLLVAGRLPGRCVRIEAKSARRDRVELRGKTGVQAHQAAALQRALLGGGFAAVLVVIPGGMWIVPWVNWRAPASSPERKSLNVQGLDRQGERFGSSQQARRVLIGLPTVADWLAAALRREWV